MTVKRFSITAEQLTWIGDNPDDPDDLCAHGDVTVEVEGRNLFYSCCASAAALQMLRTLTEDHRRDPQQLQMMPCCGHFMIADKNLENVSIVGCDYGVDYDVIHREGGVSLITEEGEIFYIPMEEYRREVLAFARTIEEFYQRCTPKKLPEDEFERNGYLAFWNEWNRRMEKEHERE